MVKRKVHHKKELVKKAPKEKKLGPAKKKVIVVGKAYSVEELQGLIASLTSENTTVEIAAVAQFAENQGAISEAAANAPDVSGTDIMELVIAAVLKNEQQILTKFEKEKNIKVIRFIARSSSIPPKVQERAAAVLERIRPPETKKAEKKEEPTLIKIPYTPKQVKSLVKDLESTVKEIKIRAAILFIKDFPRITPTVAKMPMLTVTEVTTKAVEVIKEYTRPVIDILVKKKMLPALLFLSSLGQVPLHIRKQAHDAAEKLKAKMPVPRIVAEKKIELKPLAAEKKEAPRPKEYAPLELEALLSGLDSVDRVRAVQTAKEFLKNYDIIVQAIAKAPMLTVTEVTAKAVKVIESNLDALIKELKRTKEIPALRFLSDSSKFSMRTRERAKQVLKTLMPPFEEGK